MNDSFFGKVFATETFPSTIGAGKVFAVGGEGFLARRRRRAPAGEGFGIGYGPGWEGFFAIALSRIDRAARGAYVVLGGKVFCRAGPAGEGFFGE